MSDGPERHSETGLTPRFPAIFGFPCAIETLTTTDAVGAALLHHMRPLGFDIYSIGALPPPVNPHPPPFTVDNLPGDFWDRYLDADMARHDPSLRALALTPAPVSFRQIRTGKAGFSPTARELAVLDLAAEIGAREGLIAALWH